MGRQSTQQSDSTEDSTSSLLTATTDIEKITEKILSAFKLPALSLDRELTGFRIANISPRTSIKMQPLLKDEPEKGQGITEIPFP
jgi:hypothetical protein